MSITSESWLSTLHFCFPVPGRTLLHTHTYTSVGYTKEEDGGRVQTLRSELYRVFNISLGLLSRVWRQGVAAKPGRHLTPSSLQENRRKQGVGG